MTVIESPFFLDRKGCPYPHLPVKQKVKKFMEFIRWNIDKYRRATRHLTTFQHGCYRLLIDEYMETREPLPDNDQALANICHAPIDVWLADAASIVRAFFRHKSGRLFHDYCDSELSFQDESSKFLSQRAKNAANIRWGKYKDLDATSMPVECSAMLDKRQEIRDNTVITDSELVNQPPPKNSLLDQPQSERQPIHAKPKRQRTLKPTSFIAEDFVGDIAAIALASKLGIEFEREQRKFIDHYLAKGESRADWQASFRTWLNRSAEYRVERQQRDIATRPGVRDITGAAARAAANRRAAIDNA
jgi:uncharacterized protein YdaU (DUF1376 family)